MNNQELQPALSGFFGWLKRAVANVANAIVSVSRDPFFVADIIGDIFDGGGFTVGNQNNGQFSFVDQFTAFRQVPIQDIEQINLTTYEELVLDNWVQNNFLPFYKPFFAQIKSFSLNAPSRNNLIEFYNKTQRFISVLNWYKSYSLTSLEANYTANMKTVRNQFLDVQIELLHSEINDYISKTNVAISPVVKSKIVDLQQYSQLGFNLPSSITLEHLQAEVVNNNTGTQTITNVPITQNATSTKKSSNLILWLILGIGFLKIITANNTEDVKKGGEKTQKA